MTGNRGRADIWRMALLLALMAPLPTGAYAQSAEDILLYKGADREQKLIEGAKKEGQVVIYAALIVNQAMRPIADDFRKKYPFVKLTYWRADSEDIVQKASAEVRANNVVADVIEGTGAGELAVAADIVQPYYTPAIDGLPGSLPRSEADLWAPTRLSYYGIAYNTRLVPADKVPKTYDDLLDPQWKGKMAWRIGSSSGTPLFITNLRLAWGEEQGDGLFREAQGAEDRQFRRRQRAHAGRSRHRRRICDRAEHLRPPSADQQRQGRAGQFAAHGSGGLDGRDHERGQGRQASLCGDVAGRLHPVEGRAGDLGARRIFPGRSRRLRRCRQLGAGGAEDCRRAGELRRSRQADQVHRQLRGDLSEKLFR